MRTSRLVIAIGLLCLPRVVCAQAPPPPPKHEGTAEAAFVGVAGNASSSTFGLGGEIIDRPGTWTFRQKASFIRNEAAGAVTAQSALYSPRAEKRLSERVGFFADYIYFRDRFAGIASRNAVTGGVSLKAVNQQVQTLTLDLGAGYLNEHRLTGSNISSAMYAIGSSYKLKMTATAELADELALTGNASQSNDWRLVHGVSVTAAISTVLSLKVSNVIRYAHQPAPGFKTTDTTTSVALVARFPGKK